MGLLQSLFSSVTAILSPIKRAVEDAVIGVAQQFRRSQFGRDLETIVKKGGEAVAQGLETAGQAVRAAYRAARDVFDEEQDYEKKRARDGRLTRTDEERLLELVQEREQLKQEITDLKTGLAAAKLQTESVISTLLSADELSANTGILASKVCPDCGGIMRIRQGGRDVRINEYQFWWQCVSNLNGVRCRTTKVNLHVDTPEVVRAANPDLDGAMPTRRSIWERPSMIQQTHGRVRALLGTLDEDVMCPIHVLPMRLSEKPRAGGRLLDSYQYACSSQSAGHECCSYVIPITTFPQVAALLRRNTSRGIIDA